MPYRLLADALVVFHLAFIVFALGGGVIALARPWLALLHLPAAAWATWTELTSTVCPLTPWEQSLRIAAGDAGYAGGFVEHYLIPVIYPPGLTPAVQLVLAFVVIALNAVVYALVWRRWRVRRLAVPRGP